MIRIILAFVLALLVGGACRWFDIPAPSPPKMLGALLVLTMTVGYAVTDKLIAANSAGKRPTTTQHLRGGPNGWLNSEDANRHDG